MSFPQQITQRVGSLDGTGAGDRDLPYRFGSRPRTTVPYPFSTRQYARLLILRSRVHAGLFGSDDLNAPPDQASAEHARKALERATLAP